MQVATKTLPFYKDYFSVPYPLPKIDLIAIADFAAGKYLQIPWWWIKDIFTENISNEALATSCSGAMENWGLVTYR